jgi:hypothetical protein
VRAGHRDAPHRDRRGHQTRLAQGQAAHRRHVRGFHGGGNGGGSDEKAGGDDLFLTAFLEITIGLELYSDGLYFTGKFLQF